MPNLPNNRVGIVMALKRELRGFSAGWNFEEKKGTGFPTYTAALNSEFAGIETVLCVSGLGKARAAACTQYMIDHYNPDFIINAGSAGGVCPAVHPGEIFLASSVVEYDFKSNVEKTPVLPAAHFFLRAASQLCLRTEVLGSADRNADTAEVKESLHRMGIAAADWEGAAVLKTCRSNKKEGAAIKVITDTSTSDFEKEFANNVFSFNRNLSAVVREFIIECCKLGEK